MKQITVSVVDPVGLHARPATVAVNAASKFKCEVNVAFKSKKYCAHRKSSLKMDESYYQRIVAFFLQNI